MKYILKIKYFLNYYRVWDLPSGHCIDFFSFPSPATSIDFSPAGDMLASSHVDDLGKISRLLFVYSEIFFYNSFTYFFFIISSFSICITVQFYYFDNDAVEDITIFIYFFIYPSILSFLSFLYLFFLLSFLFIYLFNSDLYFSSSSSFSIFFVFLFSF